MGAYPDSLQTGSAIPPRDSPPRFLPKGLCLRVWCCVHPGRLGLAKGRHEHRTGELADAAEPVAIVPQQDPHGVVVDPLVATGIRQGHGGPVEVGVIVDPGRREIAG